VSSTIDADSRVHADLTIDLVDRHLLGDPTVDSDDSDFHRCLHFRCGLNNVVLHYQGEAEAEGESEVGAEDESEVEGASASENGESEAEVESEAEAEAEAEIGAGPEADDNPAQSLHWWWC